MPVTSNFDRFYLNLPPFDRAKDFNNFWEKSISEIKSIPMQPEVNRDSDSKGFTNFDITYRSFKKSKIYGKLHVPKDITKPKVIILVHDYNDMNYFDDFRLNKEAAYLFLQLRGHHLIVNDPEEPAASPGYMVENILEMNNYYMRGVYLDTYRAIDMLRLNTDLDCSTLGILGKGIGGAAAVFTAAFSTRVAALALDTPSFCFLQEGQNISTSDASEEINKFLHHNKAKRKQVKKNLTYFDALNFADRLSIPILATVGFKDTMSPPQCVFALFNHLKCEKTIEVYPEQGHEAGGETQFRKSVDWLISVLNGNNEYNHQLPVEEGNTSGTN